MFKIKAVHHLGLPVNDLDRAKKFYTEVLGMVCAKVDVDIETGGLYKDVMGHYPLTARLFIENGAELVLFQRPKPLERGDFDDGTSHLSLELPKEDFTTAVADLKKAGVEQAVMAKDDSGNWHTTSPIVVPVAPDAISGLMTALAKLTSDRVVEDGLKLLPGDVRPRLR